MRPTAGANRRLLSADLNLLAISRNLGSAPGEGCSCYRGCPSEPGLARLSVHQFKGLGVSPVTRANRGRCLRKWLRRRDVGGLGRDVALIL